MPHFGESKEQNIKEADENLDSIINDCNQKLKTCEFEYQKLALLYHILSLKAEQEDSPNVYLETKKILSTYILAVEEKSSHYYEISVKKIKEFVQFLSINDKISVLRFFERSLRTNGFEKEAKKVNQFIDRLILKQLVLEFKIKNIPRLVLYSSSYSIFSIIICILLVYLAYGIILLPANNISCSLFIVDYKPYSENFYINHFLNALLDFCQVDEGFKITPKNEFGVFVLILLKLLPLLLVLNYFIKKLKDKLN